MEGDYEPATPAQKEYLRHFDALLTARDGEAAQRARLRMDFALGRVFEEAGAEDPRFDRLLAES